MIRPFRFDFVVRDCSLFEHITFATLKLPAQMHLSAVIEHIKRKHFFHFIVDYHIIQFPYICIYIGYQMEGLTMESLLR